MKDSNDSRRLSRKLTGFSTNKSGLCVCVCLLVVLWLDMRRSFFAFHPRMKQWVTLPMCPALVMTSNAPFGLWFWKCQAFEPKHGESGNGKTSQRGNPWAAADVFQVQAELRRADWMHRPQPQPAELCNWGLYLGGLSEAGLRNWAPYIFRRF